jgi:hypothetical protein
VENNINTRVLLRNGAGGRERGKERERKREREPGASGSHLIILTTQQTEIWRIMV